MENDMHLPDMIFRGMGCDIQPCFIEDEDAEDDRMKKAIRLPEEFVNES